MSLIDKFWPNNEKAFSKLADSANQHIRNDHFSLNNQRAYNFLHLYVEPSFDNHAGWTVFWPHLSKRKQADTTPKVHRVIWRRYDDMKRANDFLPSQFDPTPTLITQEATLDENQLNSLLAVGRAISVPMFDVTDSIVLDGTTYGLKWMSHSTSYQLQWPSGRHWQALTHWINQFIVFLDAALDQQ